MDYYVYVYTLYNFNIHVSYSLLVVESRPLWPINSPSIELFLHYYLTVHLHHLHTFVEYKESSLGASAPIAGVYCTYY
jgi:hypothetical protein